MSRNLLTHPLHTADDLGATIPDSVHAISVCLPTWASVLGYEEGDEEIIAKFFTGYPRFCSHRYTEDLFNHAEGLYAKKGECCLVFPRKIHAERCLEFVEKEHPGHGGRVEEMGDEKLGVAVFGEPFRPQARKFWRYCGEIVSSRLSASYLGHDDLPKYPPTQADAARVVIRGRLAAFSGADPDDVYLFPSGMAAVFAVQRMVTELRPGLPTAQCDFPYVDVLRVQKEFGSGVAFFGLADASEYDAISLLAEGGLAAIYGELPSNPLLRTVDVARLRKIADKTGTPLILDDTIGTTVNIDALPYADLLTTSLTKSFSGKGDILAGSITLNANSAHYAAFKGFLDHAADNELWAADAVILEENSRDFEARVCKSNQNAAALAAFLDAHPAVERVYYPTIENAKNFAKIQRKGRGHGPLLSLLLKDGEPAAERFFDALAVSKGPSLGTDFTLACPYTLLAHYDELEWAAECGVRRDLVRVSVGIEEESELLKRFSEALVEI